MYKRQVNDLLDEVGGRLAGTEARDEAAVGLQVVGDLHGIVLNGGVEPAEEEDHDEVDHCVDPAGGAPDVIIPPAAGLAGKGADGSGQAADGLGKDDRHNAGHCHLDGQVGVLAAVDLPAHNALGVLNGDAALGVIDEDNEQLTEYIKKLLGVMEYDVPYTSNTLMEKLGLKSREGFRKNYLRPALDLQMIEMTIPDKPNSRNQRYRKV